MAVSTDTLVFSPTTASPSTFVPISGTAQWIKAIKAGGLNMTDVSGGGVMKDPDAQITDTTRVLMTRPVSGGTTLRVVMQYHTGDVRDTTPSPPPPLTIRVFGKESSQDFWVALRNLNGDLSVPISINPDEDSRLNSSTASYTSPDNQAHSFDCDGYDRFLIGVIYKYQPASGGSPSSAVLWAKIV